MLKRFILWDFPRASWQYDVMVGIILAFIFLTPRAWFRDQPRVPRVSNIVALPSDRGTSMFYVEPKTLEDTPETQWKAKVTSEIQKTTGDGRLTVIRVEPILNSEGERQGYMAFARP